MTDELSQPESKSNSLSTYLISGVECGCILFVLFLTKEAFTYVSRSSFSLSIWVSIVFFILPFLVFISYSKLRKELIFSSFKCSLIFVFIGMFLCSILYSTFTIVLHHYIDVNYKSELAQIYVDRLDARLRKYEKNNNVTVDGKNEDYRSQILQQYSMQGILSSLKSSLFATLLLSLIIAFCVWRIGEGPKEKFDPR